MVKENSFFILLADLLLIEHLIKKYHSDKRPDVQALMEEIRRNVHTFWKTYELPQGPQASRRSESSTYRDRVTRRKKWNTNSFARSIRSKGFSESGPSAFEYYILRQLPNHQQSMSLYVESRQNELLNAMILLHEMSMTKEKTSKMGATQRNSTATYSWI